MSQYDLIVLGAGPGGYVVTIRAGEPQLHVVDGALQKALEMLVEQPLGLVAGASLGGP